METLLKGTKKLGTAGSLTKYRKHGDYNTAVKDFDSVNPIDVKIFDVSTIILFSGMYSS